MNASIHPALADAFEALERANVRWCLLRDTEELAHPPGDVDVLAAADDRARLHDALAGAGYAREKAWGGGSQMTYARTAPDQRLLLHVATRLDFHRTRSRLGCAFAGEVLAHRRRQGQLPLASDNDRFWITLARVLLDKGRASEKNRRRLSELLGAASGAGLLARSLDSALPRGWDLDRLLDTVRSENWEHLGAIAPTVQRRWRQSHPLGWARRAVGDQLSRLRRRLASTSSG